MTNGFNPGYPMNTCTGPGMSIPVSEPERVLYEVTKSNAEMVAAVNTLHNNTQKSLYDNQKLMERMARKSKKLHGKPCIMIGGNGVYCLAQLYDDGTSTQSQLIFNITGECDIYNLSFPKLHGKTKRYVAIIFMNERTWVICDKEKVTGINLYKWFVEAGIQFDPCFKDKLIKEALFDYFAPKIANARSIKELDGMAGWWQSQWRYAEWFQTFIPSGMPELPVMDKHFTTEYRGKELLEKFLKGIASIESKHYRVVVLETLVSGVLANLCQEAGIYSNYFLNFVLIGRLDKELFCRLYQVFNRGIWEIQEANVRSKLISDYVRTINDEVLIVHVPSDEDSHRRKSIERNLGDIVNKICERDCSSLNIPWKVNASLVVLNEFVSDLDSAINIIADECIFTSELTDMLKGNAVDAFLYELVTYVEAHMAEVRAVIKKWSSNQDGNMSLVLLKAIWEILSEFARDKGIDLAAALGIPGSPDWGVMWRSLTDRQEMGERMVKAVRSSMSKFYVKEKYFGCGYVKDSCYYDNEYFWIPIKVFKEIMKTNCIPSNKYRETLVKWKQQELLLPDESGLTYKLRVDGAAIQTYRFRKALFDQPLFVPIEGLGKDEEHESEKGMRVVWHPQNSENYKQCKH